MELRLLWDILKDRYKTLLAVIAGFVAVAALVILIGPKVYQSTAYIMVKKADEYPTFVKEFPQGIGILSYIDADNVLGSLELFMKNEQLVHTVIKKCNLEDVVSFSPAKFADPGLISILFRKRGVAIESQDDSEVFAIKGLSPDIQEAQKIANSFVDEFFEYYAEQKRKEIRKSKALYSKKAAELKEALAKIEAQELQYRKAHGLVDLDLQKQRLLDLLKDLNSGRFQLQAELQAKKESYDAIIKAISRNPEYLKMSETIARNELIKYYTQELAQLESQLAAKKVELTAEHPDIQEIVKKISSLRNLMRKEKERILSSSVIQRNEYYDSLIQKREDYSIDVIKIEAGLDSNKRHAREVEQELLKLLENATGLSEILRQRADLENVYKSVDGAIKLLDVAEGMDISNFIVINRAALTGDTSNYVYAPDTSLYLAIFGFAGLTLGMVIIFLQEYADNSLRLFQSFQKILTHSPTFDIQGSKGWSLLVAELAKKPKIHSIAILQRGYSREKKPFIILLAEKMEQFNERPCLVLRSSSRSGQAAQHAYKVMFVSEKEILEEADELVSKVQANGCQPALFDLPPLATCAASYFAGESFDLIVYIVPKGKVAIEEVQSDINFLYNQGWQAKIRGVLYSE